MKLKDIKTIDIQAKEWFDRINGNSYFSAQLTLNFGMKNEVCAKLPFQYGYGEHYREMAAQELVRMNIISEEVSRGAPLWRICQDNNITLRCSKQHRCLKREVIKFGI